MSKRLMHSVLATVALVGLGGCYQDDSSGPPRGQPLVRVSLTDAPFPYDSVASVNVYVVRIEASTGLDTSGGGQWVLITEPRKAFNLLDLQQGTTAFVGAGQLPAGQYHAIRMTIDTSLSSIVWNNGSKAPVNWQNYSGSNEEPLYALVEYPVNVPTDGADIVIDFDIGRSFFYNFFGTNDFILAPQLRAINAAATGAIAGTVTSAYTGQSQPIVNANVTVCMSAACDPPNAYIVATGRTDAAGHYRVAFLRAATYTVRFEQPDYPFLAPVVTPSVTVAVGDTTALSVSLPVAGAGGAYLHISGPTLVGVGGTITLVAAVGDANGNPVPNPSVTWTTLATGIATVTGTSDTALVTGQSPGGVTITATSGGLTDSHWVDVASSTGPVATVTVLPASASLAAGDSGTFNVELRDSAGTVIYPARPVSWFTTDSSVFVIEFAGGFLAIVRARAAGSAILRATSEGKVGEATITVH